MSISGNFMHLMKLNLVLDHSRPSELPQLEKIIHSNNFVRLLQIIDAVDTAEDKDEVKDWLRSLCCRYTVVDNAMMNLAYVKMSLTSLAPIMASDQKCIYNNFIFKSIRSMITNIDSLSIVEIRRALKYIFFNEVFLAEKAVEFKALADAQSSSVNLLVLIKPVPGSSIPNSDELYRITGVRSAVIQRMDLSAMTDVQRRKFGAMSRSSVNMSYQQFSLYSRGILAFNKSGNDFVQYMLDPNYESEETLEYLRHISGIGGDKLKEIARRSLHRELNVLLTDNDRLYIPKGIVSVTKLSASKNVDMEEDDNGYTFQRIHANEDYQCYIKITI